MSEDAASSSSSPGWSCTQNVQRGPRRSVVRTTEKSVVFRVRTQEQISHGRGASNGSSQQKTLYLMPSDATSSADDTDVYETLAELYAEVERKKNWLNSETQTFQQGQERLESLQQQHAALLSSLEQCKRRRKKRVRIQQMLRGPREESADYDSDESASSSDHSQREHRRRSSSHHHRQRDGAKKERKRLRRFQSDVSLRFQLLQSECRRSDLELKQEMADLRRQYDSNLFSNTLNTFNF